MHIHTLNRWQHSHVLAMDHGRAEKSTTRVMVLTAAMMGVEIVAGVWFGSMALLADGWHMGTHVAAFGITLFAYRYARSHAESPRFTFGTGKVSALGGFASAVALVVIALVMALESVMRMIEPQPIHFNQAIAVAVVGLLVNLACGFMLHGHLEEEDGHDHEPREQAHAHTHTHRDHNLRAAYLHVLADALTSVAAIVALLFGKYFGWVWMDPVMGLAGACVITKWSHGLVRDTSAFLLDGAVDGAIRTAITAAIEGDSDNLIADLHVWHLGPTDLSATLSIVTHHPRPPEHYKQLLSNIPNLSHVLVEVNACAGRSCLKPSV
ncbi:MAG: CDF family Co(II)/Ni(II) efflux transporter DmeF [Syntrophobacteraceae bacterium]